MGTADSPWAFEYLGQNATFQHGASIRAKNIYALRVSVALLLSLQGDPSGRLKPPVDLGPCSRAVGSYISSPPAAGTPQS